MTTEIYGSDAYAPNEVARRIETIGVAKAQMALLPLTMLGVLAGAFIGLGSLLSVIVRSDPGLGFAASQLGAGVAFSLGLVLVVVAGAELFTGNNLLVMAWADRRITSMQVLRNWLVVCAANFAGAVEQRDGLEPAAAGRAGDAHLLGSWRKPCILHPAVRRQDDLLGLEGDPRLSTCLAARPSRALKRRGRAFGAQSTRFQLLRGQQIERGKYAQQLALR
jgi:hypothetical protein